MRRISTLEGHCDFVGDNAEEGMRGDLDYGCGHVCCLPMEKNDILIYLYIYINFLCMCLHKK